MMSLNFCLDAVVLACSNLYTNYFSAFKIRARISEIRTRFFLCFREFVHEFVREFASELCTRNS